MTRTVALLVFTALVSSGLTAIVVHNADGAAVVTELRREDSKRQRDDDEAKAWLTQPLEKGKY